MQRLGTGFANDQAQALQINIQAKHTHKKIIADISVTDTAKINDDRVSILVNRYA